MNTSGQRGMGMSLRGKLLPAGGALVTSLSAGVVSLRLINETPHVVNLLA
jgi:hypothetical protein